MLPYTSIYILVGCWVHKINVYSVITSFRQRCFVLHSNACHGGSVITGEKGMVLWALEGRSWYGYGVQKPQNGKSVLCLDYEIYSNVRVYSICRKMKESKSNVTLMRHTQFRDAKHVYSVGNMNFEHPLPRRAAGHAVCYIRNCASSNLTGGVNLKECEKGVLVFFLGKIPAHTRFRLSLFCNHCFYYRIDTL